MLRLPMSFGEYLMCNKVDVPYIVVFVLFAMEYKFGSQILYLN